MATIANLAVSLTARIGNFEKGFMKARKTVMRFASDIGRHIKTVTMFGAAIAGLAAGAMLRLAGQQRAVIDEMSKMSRVLGLTTEQLAGYQHAASLAGVDSDAFTKSVTRMNRTIADAESGLSTAKRELERVGLSAEALAGMSTDQRIKVIADRYNSIGDAAARSSFLMNVFGRAGLGMGNLFEQGAAGIEAAQKEAEKLGLTFNAVDARMVEEANDAITRMQALITGAARRLAIQLSPYIQAAADYLRDMGMAGEGMGAHVTNAFNYIIKAVARAADYFELLKAGIYGFQAVVQGVAHFVISIFSEIGKAITDVINLIPGMNVEFTGFLDQLGKDFGDKFIDSTNKAKEAFKNFSEGVNSKNAEATFEKIRQKAEEIAKSTARTASGFNDIDEIAEKADKTAQFGQAASFQRMAIGTGASSPKDQPVTRKQGEMQISILQQIARNTSQPAAVIS